ncbi:MAG: hemolysin family protein [Candidatus Gracilibacteria bacterium]
MEIEIALVVFLIALSAVSSASETALISLTPAQVRTLVEAKKHGANYLAKLKQQHHKTLILILVWNNFVNIAASALTTVMMTKLFHSAGVGIAMGVLTVLILVFGEILPKSLATAHAKGIGCFVAPAIYFLGVIMTPIIWLLDLVVSGFLKLFGVKHHIQVTDEELIAMASIGAEEGSIDEHELELIENALEFNDIPVEGIMTPRVHVDALPETLKLDEATEFAVNHTHTRIPVYRDNIDHIVGILSLKELLKQYHTQENPEETSLRQVNLLTPLKVPHTMKVQELFRQFKKKRMHMAVVIDEYGGTLGIVTMEDLLEELVGDIEDEQDLEEEHIKKISDHVYELSGRVELDDLAKIMKVEFEHPGYKTVSFLIIDTLGYLPHEGQSVVFENWQFTVTHMLRSTILKVKLEELSS